MAENIDLGTDSSVTIGERKSPIEFGDGMHPNGEFGIHPYRFKDERGKESDGAVFRIKPGGSTQVMRTIEKGYVAQRIAIKGSGLFVGISPEGEVVTHEIGENIEQNPLIELTEGWVDCFIAGPDGLEVVDVSTPPFELHMEEEIPYQQTEDDKKLNSPLNKFWRIYNEEKYADRELDWDHENYYDLWDIARYSPWKQWVIISQRLHDEEVRHFFPEAYERFVVQGPRRPEYDKYKPAELNEHDYFDFTYDHMAEEDEPPSLEKPLTDTLILSKKAKELVLARKGVPVDEATFRQIVDDHMREVVERGTALK